MELKGWVRTSLIDYPDHIATVLFSGGCNFRCPMCHNADLVARAEEMPTLPHREVWAFLSKRVGLVDGIVVTGGEPTLQSGLIPFLQRARELGLDVKLDTNGYLPDVLAALLRDRLVSYVAMDVKAPPPKYALVAGRDDLDLKRIEDSIGLLLAGDVAYEFRTTVVPGLLVEEDVDGIAHWVSGAVRYVLQPFRPLGTLDPALGRVSPYPLARLEAMAERARTWVGQVLVRGT